MNLNWLMIWLNRAGVPFLVMYLIGMVAYPFYIGDWNHVHSVWSHWQTLNVGVLAFLSSLIAFNISRFNAEKQRKRELIAATVLLPQTLSELTTHFKNCASVLAEGWDKTADNSSFSPGEIAGIPPEPADSISAVFSNCIKHSDSRLAAHLATILKKLQINNSRLRSFFDGSPNLIITRSNIQNYFFCLAELQALVNATFPYARGDAETIGSVKLTLQEINEGYLNLDLDSALVDGLQERTKQLVDE